MPREAAVSGVATVALSTHGDTLQITIVPGSASGTGTLTAQPYLCDAFESVFDSAGSAMTAIDLSAQSTHVLTGKFGSVKVTSSNSGDTFDLVAI